MLIVALGLQFTVVGETQQLTALEMFYCSGLAAVVVDLWMPNFHIKIIPNIENLVTA